MRTYLYVLFGLMILTGFVMISFSFPSHQETNIGQFFFGSLIAVAGIVGCLCLEKSTQKKEGDNNGQGI